MFDALGYAFRWNEHEQWVGLLPDAELDWFPHMRAENTIVLLVLALTWQEEINRGGAGARAVVTSKRPFSGPPYIKRGRKVIYRRRDLEAWLDAQTVEERRRQGRPTKAEQVMRRRMQEGGD